MMLTAPAPKALKRFSSMSKKDSYLWLVYLNGSELSKKGLRLTTMLMDPVSDKIKCVIVTNPKSGAPLFTPEHLENVAKEECEKAQVNTAKRFDFENFVLEEGETESSGLIAEANKANLGRTVLVIGGSGAKDGDVANRRKSLVSAMPHPRGEAPMGKLADACVEHAKVAVLVVRHSPKALDEVEEAPMLRRGMKSLRAKGKGGGPLGGHGLTIAVSVESKLAQDAFDFGRKLCRPGAGDELVAMHLHANAAPDVITQKKFEFECQKAEESVAALKAKCITVDAKSARDRYSALQHLCDGIDDENADLVVVGSEELSKVNADLHLGSLAFGLAERCTAHVLIVKAFGHHMVM